MASLVRPSLVRHCRVGALPPMHYSCHSIYSSTTACRSFLANAQKASQRAMARDASDTIQGLAIPSQKVTFHSSAARSILPPLPQRIHGTANDAAPVPEPSPTHGSYHWTFERLLAAGLVPLTIAPFAVGSLNPVMDAILCGSIIIHSHIGFQACIIDYFPKRRVPKTRAALWWLLRGATVLVGVGLYEFETNDVGVTEAVKKIWAS